MRTLPRRRSISDFSYTPLAAALAAALVPQAASAIDIVVTNGSDVPIYDTVGNNITLSGAINFLNGVDEESGAPNCTGSDTISFFHGSNGDVPFAVSVSSELDVFCSGLVINGGGTKSTAFTTLNGSGAYGGNYMLMAQADDVHFNGMELVNWTYGQGYALGGSVNADNNIIRANGNGIWIWSYGGSTSVTRNAIFANTNDPLDIEAGNTTSVQGNLIGMDGTGSAAFNFYGVYATNSQVDISNNTILANPDNGYASVYLDVDNASNVSGNFIGTDSTGEFSGGWAGVYVSTASGTTISGNTISGTVSSASEGGGGVFIDQGSSGVSIDANYIGTDSSGNSNTNPDGVYVLCGSNASVTNNAIAASNDFGIHFDGVTGGGSTDIVGNRINVAGDGVTALGESSYGVLLTSTTCGAPLSLAVKSASTNKRKHGKTKIAKKALAHTKAAAAGATTNVMISGNTIGATDFAGIYLGGADGTKITDDSGANSLTNNFGVGIYLDFSVTNTTISGNNISSNESEGIYSWDADSTTIHNNTINGNGYTGVFLDSDTTNTTVSNNTIASNSSDGIFISGATPVEITANTITGNSGYGVNIAYGSSINIHDNVSIYGNTPDDSSMKNVNLDFSGAVYRNDTFTTSGFPNNGMTPPVIVSAIPDSSSGTTTVSFSLSAPPGTYNVQLCDNPATTAPGCNEIAKPSISMTVPAVGTPGTTSVVLNSVTLDNFSAMAIDSSGNSSEFSEVVTLTATPAATFSATELDFGPVASGRSSAPQTITIRSTGSAPYVITGMGPECENPASICTSGGFLCSTTCQLSTEAVPFSYAPGQTCTITATFMPTSVTSYSQSFSVCDNAYGGRITLTGTGVTPPPVSFDPASFDFGTVNVGTQSPQQAFSVFNTGTTVVTLGTPAIDDNDFVIVGGTCGTSLAPNTGCEIDVAFQPLGFGQINGALSLPAGASLGSLQVKRIVHGKAALAPSTSAVALLTGTGAAVASITLPSAVDLGIYTLGDPPNSQNVVLTNTGNKAVNISSVTVSGPFGLTNGCPSSLAPNTSCAITLTYSSTSVGNASGALVIITDAPGASGSIPVTAKTVPSRAPIITVTPAQIGFGDRLLGVAGPTQRITISNVGNASGTVSISTSNNDFLINSTNCTPTLAAGATCVADVSLRPVGFGTRVGTFTVTSNAAGSPFNVQLSGSGCRPYSAGSSRLGSSFGCSP